MSKTPIADMVARMLLAGSPVDSLVDAVASAEVERFKTLEKRRKWDRERQARKRAAQSSPVDVAISSLSFDSEVRFKKERKRPQMQKPTGDLFGNLPPAPDDWPEDFAALFWSTWPRHPRKHSREQVTAKLGRIRRSGKVTWAALFGGLQAYLGTNPEPKFIPAPMVWLNQSRWEADYGVMLTARPPEPKTSPMLDYAAEQMRHVREG